MLSVGQIGKDRPVTLFELLRFEPRPEAFCLGIVEALAAASLRAHGLVVVEQLAVGLAALQPAAVGVHEQARGGAAS